MIRALTHVHERRRTALCHGISTGSAPCSLASDAKEAKMSRLNTLTCRITLTLAALAAAAPVWAQEPLAQEQHINDSLRAGRIGDVIRKTCPTIDARMFVVFSKLEALKQYAVKQGYKEPQGKGPHQGRGRRLAEEGGRGAGRCGKLLQGGPRRDCQEIAGRQPVEGPLMTPGPRRQRPCLRLVQSERSASVEIRGLRCNGSGVRN